MKKWELMWLNIRDTFLDKIEGFMDEFLTLLRESVSREKLILFGAVVLLAIGLIITDHLSSGDSPPEVPESESSPSNPSTHLPGDNLPPTAQTPADTGTRHFSLKEKEQALKVAREFVQKYATYGPDRNIADQIKPYVTAEFYNQQRSSDESSRPTYEVYQSKVLSIDQGFIEPIDFNLYWTGTAELELTNADGKKRKETMNYAVMLVKDDEEWKVSEVTAFNADDLE